MSTPEVDYRNYLVSEGVIGRRGDIEALTEALSQLFDLGSLSDEGFVVNDPLDGSTHGTSSQEYIDFKDRDLLPDPSAVVLPNIIGVDITFIKHPSPTNPLFQYDVSIRTQADLSLQESNHFRFTYDHDDATAWIFAPTHGSEKNYLRVGTWKEMNIDELNILYDILGEIQALDTRTAKSLDTLS